MLLKIQVLLLSCFCVASISLAKTLEAYCGFKTLELRYCAVDDDCIFSDEFCGPQGWCVTDQSLYLNDPCGWNTGNDWGAQWTNPETDKCATVRCRDGYHCFGGVCFKNKV
eukprot:403377530